MGRKIAVLPLEDWQGWEREMQAMQNRLCIITVEVGKGVPLHHKVIRKIDKARHALLEARVALENPCYLATGHYPDEKQRTVPE